MIPTEYGYYWAKYKHKLYLPLEWEPVSWFGGAVRRTATADLHDINHFDWGPRIPTPDEPIKIPKNFNDIKYLSDDTTLYLDTTIDYGCVSQGFCAECKVFTYGSPCLCAGNCCICGGYLIKRGSYGELDGVYKTIDCDTKKEWYQVYEKGKYVRTIQDGLTYLPNGAAENVDFD